MREMTEAEINDKHSCIRGSLAYKYPAPEAACRHSCGQEDDKGDDLRHHRCVLAVGHEGSHQWSWECKLMKERMVGV